MMAFHMRRALAAVIVSMSVMVATAASAQPAGDAAKATEASKLYDEGKRHFDIGEYAEAIASWKHSYLLSSAPLLLFNIAQAYRLSNNCAQANRFYLNYKRVEKQPKNQTELDKAMAKCAGVEAATGDTTEPAKPTTIEPAKPPPEPVASPPVTAPAPVKPSPPLIVHASDRGGGWRTTGLITTSVGASALVVSGLYALKARQNSSTLSGEPFGTSYSGAVAATDADGKSAATRSKYLLALGGLLAVGGGIMWYVGHRQGESHVDVAIVPGHAEVSLSCAF